MGDLQLRLATNEDAHGIQELVDLCYRKYPPYQLFLEDEPELRTPADSFEAFWVIEEGQDIVGSIAAMSHGSTRVELKKLYLHPRHWGSGWASELESIFVEWGSSHGFTNAELWSDVLFTRAHEFYRKCGWLETGMKRELRDTNGDYAELQFSKALEPSDP